MAGQDSDRSNNAFHPTIVIAASMRDEDGIASTVTGGGRESCDRKLDRLDLRYDDRRKPRQSRKDGGWKILQLDSSPGRLRLDAVGEDEDDKAHD